MKYIMDFSVAAIGTKLAILAPHPLGSILIFVGVGFYLGCRIASPWR